MRLETRRMMLSATAENTSRWCRVGFRIKIDGGGEALLPDPLMFGLAFAEPPWLSVGADIAGMSPWQLRRTSLAEQITQTPYVPGRLPAVAAVATEWITESTGKFVTGAKVAVYVDAGAVITSTISTPASAGRVQVTAHLLFQGDGLKTFPMPDSM